MWAIRDVSHGKTYHFDTFEAMLVFVRKLEKQLELLND